MKFAATSFHSFMRTITSRHSVVAAAIFLGSAHFTANEEGEKKDYCLDFSLPAHLGDVERCSIEFHSFCTELVYEFIRYFFFFNLSFWLVSIRLIYIIAISDFPHTHIVCVDGRVHWR